MTIAAIISNIVAVLSQLIGLLFVLATVIFLFGVIMYVIAGGDEKKVSTAKTYIIWGIVGLFIMVAMWGIVRAVCNTTGLQCSWGGWSGLGGGGIGGFGGSGSGYWCTNQGVTSGCFTTFTECQRVCGGVGGSCSSGQACVFGGN